MIEEIEESAEFELLAFLVVQEEEMYLWGGLRDIRDISSSSTVGIRSSTSCSVVLIARI